MLKPKVGFITQRFGKEVLGGAEMFAMQIAQNMKETWDIDILTTCSKDHITWDSFYDEGMSNVD